MTDENSTNTSPGNAAREEAQRAINDRGSTIEQIKESFGLLLDLRDRKIKQLEKKLFEATQKEAKTSLLVIDDALSMAGLMKRYLTGEPMTVVCIASNKAIEHLARKTYDVIMIESTAKVQENMDGVAFCKKFNSRLQKKGKTITMVLMSSRPGEQIKNEAEEAGASFLRKPFNRDQFLTLMRDVHVRGKP